MSSDARTKIVKNAVLIDGSGMEPLKNAGLLIKGNTILEVGEIRDQYPTHGTDVEVIDVEGKTIMPGLIDAHSHLTYNDEMAKIPSMFYFTDPTHTIEYNTIRSALNAKIFLDSGVTTMRDIGSRGGIAVAVRDAVNKGHIPGPRIVASGPIISGTAGLVDFHPNWIKIDPHFNLGVIADGKEELVKIVRQQVKMGVDNIKIGSTGTWLSVFCGSKTPTMDVDEIQTVVKEAHKFGIRVASHAEGNEGIINSVKGGVDSVEHATYLDEESADLCRKSGKPVVSTISSYGYFFPLNAPKIYAVAMPPIFLERIKEDAEAQRNAPRFAREGKVKLGLGADTTPPLSEHGTTAMELEFETRFAGLSNMEAICAATSGSAEAVGLKDRVGTLEKGKFADLLVLNGDPLKDIATLQDKTRLNLIMKDGIVYKDGLRYSAN
ncbi:MAG: amidohydrolase family protein [Candidatus Bathyarchaeia archaeon]